MSPLQTPWRPRQSSPERERIYTAARGTWRRKVRPPWRRQPAGPARDRRRNRARSQRRTPPAPRAAAAQPPSPRGPRRARSPQAAPIGQRQTARSRQPAPPRSLFLGGQDVWQCASGYFAERRRSTSDINGLCDLVSGGASAADLALPITPRHSARRQPGERTAQRPLRGILALEHDPEKWG